MQVDTRLLLDKTPGPQPLYQPQTPIRIITKFGAQWDQVRNIQVTIGIYWLIYLSLEISLVTVLS